MDCSPLDSLSMNFPGKNTRVGCHFPFQGIFWTLESNLPLPLEKAMAPHSSTLAWKIPWTEEPGGLQLMGSLKVRHDWATSLSLFTFVHWRRKWQPTPVFLPGESQGRGAWWAAVYGVAHSRTRLKRLSSCSSHCRQILYHWATKKAHVYLCFSY